MTSSKIRVRFPPSPTGFLHLGSLRTALYNYLFARRHGGVFILRIEDTDQSRYVPGAVENLLTTLRWVGLEADEGLFLGADGNPVVRGTYGPYVQSERIDLYKKYTEELVDQGSAYLCFCSSERLEEIRREAEKNKKPIMYDGACRALDVAAARTRRDGGAAYVIRLKVPHTGFTEVHDLIRGSTRFPNELIDDQVLVKSDGFPTYHLANVVDDHLMEISHVIRGEEWLSSTPKHMLLYQAFGWPAPQFAHLPLLLNADKSKLSKRQNDAAVEDYMKKGYLPEALINFIALLGWNPKGDQEIYSREELIAAFDLEKVNKSGAVVNFQKLDWMNGEYIKKMAVTELTAACRPYLEAKGLLRQKDGAIVVSARGALEVSPSWIARVIAVEQERMRVLAQVGEETTAVFHSVTAAPQDLVWKNSTKEETRSVLAALADFLTEAQEEIFASASLTEENIRAWMESRGLGQGSVLWPMRVALSGALKSPPPFVLAALLGKTETIARLRAAQKTLEEVQGVQRDPM